MFKRQREFRRANQRVGQLQRSRAAARAVRVEQIQNFFLADRRGHRDAGGFDFGKTRAQRPRPRDDAGHAEADVVRALVAEHLRRHSGHDGAFDGGRAVGVDELFGQRGEKSRRGRAKADADDVRVHARAFDLCVVRSLAHAKMQRRQGKQFFAPWRLCVNLNRIIQRFARHHFRQRFGGAVFGEAAAGKAAVEFGAQADEIFQAVQISRTGRLCTDDLRRFPPRRNRRGPNLSMPGIKPSSDSNSAAQ